MPKYWVVRAAEDIQDLIEREGFIGVRFGGDALGDLSGLSKEEIRLRVQNARPNRSAGYHGVAVGQLWRFIDEIEEGDYLLTPTLKRDERAVRIGVVRGAYRFARGLPRPHRRPVGWIRSVSRDILPPIKSQLTVFSMNRHADELDGLTTA